MALENSIIPVHKQTENLQRLQENVDKTLFCLDHVISYYHVAKDTDKIIKEGCVFIFIRNNTTVIIGIPEFSKWGLLNTGVPIIIAHASLLKKKMQIDFN